MKPYFLLFLLPCVLIVPIVLYQTASRLDEVVQLVDCHSLLQSLNTNVSILLIDSEILEQIDKNQCTMRKSIKIGVDVKYLSKQYLLEDSRFDVWYFSNDSKKDYLDFRTKPRMVIPKKFPTRWVGSLEVPLDIPTFLGFWKRAKFLECLRLDIPRKSKRARIKVAPGTRRLANLRDELLKFGIFSFLNGGTLLGWYRECSVIPHTNDFDIAIFVDDFNPEFLKSVERNSSRFRLSQKLGRLNDSFEMTLAPRNGYRVFIDVFMMYEEVVNGSINHWVSGLRFDGSKYKYSYGLYNPWCSADLAGHLFWVTCSPEEKLVMEYGSLWYQDHPTIDFDWKTSHRNVKRNGNFSSKEMRTLYKRYKE